MDNIHSIVRTSDCAKITRNYGSDTVEHSFFSKINVHTCFSISAFFPVLHLYGHKLLILLEFFWGGREVRGAYVEGIQKLAIVHPAVESERRVRHICWN